MQTIKNLKYILIMSAIVLILMLFKVAKDRRWPGNAGEAAEKIAQRTAFISSEELRQGGRPVTLVSLGNAGTGDFPSGFAVIKTDFNNLVAKETLRKLRQSVGRKVIVADSAGQAVNAWIILDQLGVDSLFIFENQESDRELFKYQFRPDTTFRPESVIVEE